MKAGFLLTAGVAGLLTVLAACEDGSGAGSNSFRKDYTAARGALEAGQFDKANRIYARMLSQAGPLQPRIQLEYAHSLLRSGAYDAAATQARALSQSQSGTDRSAALAVLGTAQHELGLSALSVGDPGAGRQNLAAAQSSIAEVLKADPDLDPLGALAGRLASIKVRLKALS